MQVPPGPQAELEGLGQGHTAPFPRGPRVHSLPRARGQACSPLPRTQAALPTPTRLAAFGEELGPHRNHLAPMVRGRKSGKRTPAMITGSPLHMGRGLLSFVAPAPRCSAFCTRPVGRVCQAREQEELGARLQEGRLPQARQFYVNTRTEAKLQPPGPALGPLFRKPSAFVEPTL